MEELDPWLSSLKPNANTRRTYRHAAAKFLAWLEAAGKTLDALTEEDANAYKVALMESGISAASVNLNLSAVRSLLKYLDNPAGAAVTNESVKAVPKRDFLDIADVWDLLATCNKNTELGLRNYCILNLMIRTGLREKEVAQACIGDLEMHTDTALLWVRGKGRIDKDDYVTLYPGVLGEIDRHLELYRDREDKDAPLFTTVSNRNAGTALAPRTVSHIIKEKLRQIGFDDAQHTGHSLRHTAITLALEGGATPKQVQTMARHATTTTQIYVHDFERRKNPAEAAIEKLLGD